MLQPEFAGGHAKHISNSASATTVCSSMSSNVTRKLDFLACLPCQAMAGLQHVQQQRG
jgi:hypothetical protein